MLFDHLIGAAEQSNRNALGTTPVAAEKLSDLRSDRKGCWAVASPLWVKSGHSGIDAFEKL